MAKGTPRGDGRRGARRRRGPGKGIHLDVSLKTLVIAVAGVAGVWLFLQLWPILVVVGVSLMIVGALNPFVARLESRGVKRSHAIAVTFGALFVAAGLFGAILVPRLGAQLSELIERLPRAQAQLADRLQATKLGAPIAKSLREARSTELMANIEHLGLSYSSRIVEIVAYSVTSLFLALYFMIDRDRMRGTGFALIPRNYHVRASRILLNLETIVGGYLRGQVITSIMMCVFTLIVLEVARVPNALTLSLFAGIVDVLPYVGGLLLCVPAFLVALSRGTPVAVVVLVALALYQEIESRLIVPRVYGRVLRLPAATVMLSLLVGGKLLGILGALLALPVAAGIRMIVAELRVELPGEDVKDPELLQRDEAAEHAFEVRAAGTRAIEAAAIATEIAEERRDQEAAVGAAPSEVSFVPAGESIDRSPSVR